MTLRHGKADAPAIVRVENRGNAPAYWVNLNSPWPFPGDFTITAQTYRSRLDPGESIDIPVLISHAHRPGSEAEPDGPREIRGAEVELSLRSAHTKPIPVTIPVRVLAPELRIHDYRVLNDADGKASAVQVTIVNKGQQDSEGVTVSVEFLDAATGEVLHRTPPEHFDGPLLPTQLAKPLSFTLPPDVVKMDQDKQDVLVKVVMVSDIWPTYVWTALRSLRAPPPDPAWLSYLGMSAVILLVLGGFITYQLVFRNATVTRYQAEPTALRRAPLIDLPRINRRLGRARKLDPLLEELDIPRPRWNALIAATDEPVKALVQALRASSADPESVADALVFHPIELPALPIPIETETAIVELTGDTPPDLRDVIEAVIAQHELQSSYVLILDRTNGQDAAERLREAPLRVAIIDQRDVAAIALAARPVAELCRVIARTARLGDISPYQTSGGLAHPDHFFGRENELALMTGREARNHLVIGARQMGKSSLLKRLEYRYPDRVHLVTLTGTDLDHDLERAGLPRLDELRPSAPDAPAPFLLLDEADLLIREDREQGYPLCRRLRAIAEEGRCRFVLAGFWELHRAAYLEHQSPVRNFADPLPLGPLDERAARELATQPLATLGLRWASDDLVTELLERTGCRPNLIATACDAAIRLLPPLGQRTLDADILHAVLDINDESGAALDKFFRDLGALIRDPRACRIDRIVLYATVDQDSFTIDALRAQLKSADVEIPNKDLQESLERLTLAYAIKKKSGSYIYPVPLIRDSLRSTGDPTETLAMEVREWNEAAA